jgi:hypothetical protein
MKRPPELESRRPSAFRLLVSVERAASEPATAEFAMKIPAISPAELVDRSNMPLTWVYYR